MHYNAPAVATLARSLSSLSPSPSLLLDIYTRVWWVYRVLERDRVGVALGIAKAGSPTIG